MRKNSYLIEFRFHGYAKKYLKKIIFEVSKRFNVKGVTRKRVVPHITLYGPFSTGYEKKMVSEVVSAIKDYHLVPFKLTEFDHFDKKVVYIEIEPSEKLKNLRVGIAQRLLPISKHEEEKTRKIDSACNFKFHGTIAFKDIEEKFDRIWNFLKSKEEPAINQHLLRITIIKNKRILYEYDLIQKKLLNRKQALNKNIWKKTILLSQIKNKRNFF
jgi:2'-5' RNA ligase